MAQCGHTRSILSVSSSWNQTFVRHSSNSTRKFSRFQSFNDVISRIRGLIGPHFLKKISSSSYWLCHCLLRQSVFITAQKIQTYPGHYLSLFACFKSRFYSRTLNPTFLAAFSPIVLSAATGNNNDGNITDEIMASHSKDLEYIKSLTQTTLTCKICQKRHYIDQKVQDIEYCSCPDRKSSVYGVKNDEGEAWTPFLERKDILGKYYIIIYEVALIMCDLYMQFYICINFIHSWIAFCHLHLNIFLKGDFTQF